MGLADGELEVFVFRGKARSFPMHIIYRPRDLVVEIGKYRAKAQEAIESARRVLQLPAPDTFLGRKSYEPFPTEDDGGPPAK
jgi:hypothetical protein